MNYFELLQIPESFEIDINLLNHNYFKLQQEFHPDKQPDNIAKSAEINKAYNILKNRFHRAEYMVGTNLKSCPAILLEVMEMYETGNKLKAQNELEQLYAEFSKTTNTEYKQEIFTKIKYLTKFLEDR